LNGELNKRENLTRKETVEEKENYNKVGIPAVASISQGHVKDLFFFSSRGRKCRADESQEPSSFCFSSVLLTRSPSSHLPFHKPNVRKYYKALPAAFQLRIWRWCGFCVLAERAPGRVCTAIERSMLR
jgi:hypothetical protein